jgi:hypothetical protein
MSSKGFTIWQVQDNILCQQTKKPFLPDEQITQVLETTPNVVVCSTMSCTYYKFNLKTGNSENIITGSGKYCVDLIRAPIFDKSEEECHKYCGIEGNCIVLIDFERMETKRLQTFSKNEFKSPWYSATFFLKDKFDFMVVGEE